MTERPEAFDFFGPRTLVGPALKAGDQAPDFALINNRFETVSLAHYSGKPLVISVVPSLDTGVCTKQTIRFNDEAAALTGKVAFVTVSADLPFAQTRWCGSNDAQHMQTLSDHRDMSFGQSYGTYVRDFRIESRAVFIVDSEGVIRHAEYVHNAGHEPDYSAALEVIKGLVD